MNRKDNYHKGSRKGKVRLTLRQDPKKEVLGPGRARMRPRGPLVQGTVRVERTLHYLCLAVIFQVSHSVCLFSVFSCRIEIIVIR